MYKRQGLCPNAEFVQPRLLQLKTNYWNIDEAYKQAEQLRGQGDAEAAGIYAESFSQDPEFYEFTRSMKAYVETFESKSDVMLIDSESEFFKYLNDKKDEN